MLGHDVRIRIGAQLATFYDAHLSPLPLSLVELLARLAVADAMAEFDRARLQPRS